MSSKDARAQQWEEAYFLWTKIFALTFALGVVTGITMSFQFGTNWPGYMQTVGNIAGPLLAYEVLTAFFLEATFLGIMLFGFNRVSNRVHTIATLLVAFGTSVAHALAGRRGDAGDEADDRLLHVKQTEYSLGPPKKLPYSAASKT